MYKSCLKLEGSHLSCSTLEFIAVTPVVNEQQIRAHYNALYEAWVPQRWWPARSPF
jgi:hypothetical protein